MSLARVKEGSKLRYPHPQFAYLMILARKVLLSLYHSFISLGG